MVPVALVAAVLAPAAHADVAHVGLPDVTAQLPDAQAPPPEPQSSALPVAAAQALDLMRQWLDLHAVPQPADPQAPNAPPAPAAPAAPAAPHGTQPQGGPIGQAYGTAATLRDQGYGRVHDTQDQANGQAQWAQGQAGQAVQGALDQVQSLRDLLPDDPVGSAQRAAEQAVGGVPGVFEDPGMEPQSSSAKTVESNPGLLPPILAGSILVAGAAGATFVAFWFAGSSGTVASGAAAAKGSTELRRLLPFASPLFTRFERETVLGHPRREALYALILQQPGISLQALGESTGLSRTAVLHHLRLLEMQHLIVSKRMGRSRHYYENGGRYGRDAKEAYAILQNPRSKEVAEFIRTHPGAMQKHLCEALAIQPSIAHWHVRRLQQAQLVECVRQGRAVNYFPGRGLLEVAAQPAIPALPEATPAPVPAPVASPLPSAFPA